MESTQKDRVQLSRKESYEVLNNFEELKDVETEEKDLEDVTELIFDQLKTLKGCQMICKPDLDLYDTMSCFEVMDAKMDSRMHRKEGKTIQ